MQSLNQSQILKFAANNSTIIYLRLMYLRNTVCKKRNLGFSVKPEKCGICLAMRLMWECASVEFNWGVSAITLDFLNQKCFDFNIFIQSFVTINKILFLFGQKIEFVMNCPGEEPDSSAGECWYDQNDLPREQGCRGELRESKKTVRRRGPEYQVCG
jgi:hypothetical protein